MRTNTSRVGPTASFFGSPGPACERFLRGERERGHCCDTRISGRAGAAHRRSATSSSPVVGGRGSARAPVVGMISHPRWSAGKSCRGRSVLPRCAGRSRMAHPRSSDVTRAWMYACMATGGGIGHFLVAGLAIRIRQRTFGQNEWADGV
jgi:hypothetical protein